MPPITNRVLVTREELGIATWGWGGGRYAHGSMAKTRNVKMYSLMCPQSNSLGNTEGMQCLCEALCGCMWEFQEKQHAV